MIEYTNNKQNPPDTGLVGVDGGGVALDDELELTATMVAAVVELLLLVLLLLLLLRVLLLEMLLVVGLTTKGLTGWLACRKRKNILIVSLTFSHSYFFNQISHKGNIIGSIWLEIMLQAY